MKFPKLKHPTICQIFLYLPALAFFAAIAMNIVFAKYYGAVVTVLVLISGAAFSIVYLFRNAALLIISDILFSSIRYWKKARSVYFSDKNGCDLATAEKRILSRLKGKSIEPLQYCLRPIAFRYRRRRPMTVFYFAVEKMTLVYSVDLLTEEIFRQIMDSARLNALSARAPKEQLSTFLMDKTQKKADIGCGVGVVILAQRSEIALTERKLKADNGEFGCIVPCVAVLSEGAYYFDSMREAYMPGMTEKPQKNYAIDILQSAVFSGRLPLKGNENYLPYVDKDTNPEMTLWELMRMFKETMQDIKQEERGLAKKLSHGDVFWQDDWVYCKLEKRMATFSAQKKDNCVEVLFDGMWSYPKLSHISKKDQQEIRRRIEAYFASIGCKTIFISE